MKNRMPKRKTIGKISTYLRNQGFTGGGQSEERSERKGTSMVPNSVKKGGGTHVHRIRSLKQVRKSA